MWSSNNSSNAQNFEGNQFNYGHTGQLHPTPSQQNIYEGLAAEMQGSDAFRTLFLGDLSYFCTEDDLCAIFAPFGSISTVRVRRGVTGESLMHGFIALDSHEAAKRAITELDSKIFMGRSMRVQLSSEGPRPSAPKEGLVQIHVSFISKQLNFLVTEVVLREIFAPFGRIADVAVRRHTIVQKQNRQSGYGFVYFLDIDAAYTAMAQLKQNTVREITFDCSISHKSEHFGRSPSSSTPKNMDFNSQNHNNNNRHHKNTQNNAGSLRGISRSVSDSFSPQNHDHFHANNTHSSVMTLKPKNDPASHSVPSIYIPQQGNQGQQPQSLFWGNNTSTNNNNNNNNNHNKNSMNNKQSADNISNNINNNIGVNNNNPRNSAAVSLTALSAGSTPRTQAALSSRVGSGDSYSSTSYLSLQSFPSTALSTDTNESLSNKMMLLSPTWANANNSAVLSSHSGSNSTINTPISQQRHVHPSFANTSGNFNSNGSSASGNDSLLCPNSLVTNNGSNKSFLTATAPEFVPASSEQQQSQLQPQISAGSTGNINGMFSRLSAFSSSNNDTNLNNSHVTRNNINNGLSSMMATSDDALFNFPSFTVSLPTANPGNALNNNPVTLNSPTWSTVNNNSSLLANNSAIIGSGLSSSVASSYTSQQSNSLLLSSSISLGLLESNTNSGGGNRSRHGSSHSVYSLFDSYATAQNSAGNNNSNSTNTSSFGVNSTANTLASPVLSSGHTSSGSSLSTLNLTTQNMQNTLLQGNNGENINGINVNGNNMFMTPPSSNLDVLAVSNMSSLMMNNGGNKATTSLLHHNIVSNNNNANANHSLQQHQNNNSLIVEDDPFAFVISLNNNVSSNNTNNANNDGDNNNSLPPFLQLGLGTNSHINTVNHSYSI